MSTSTGFLRLLESSLNSSPWRAKPSSCTRLPFHLIFTLPWFLCSAILIFYFFKHTGSSLSPLHMLFHSLCKPFVSCLYLQLSGGCYPLSKPSEVPDNILRFLGRENCTCLSTSRSGHETMGPCNVPILCTKSAYSRCLINSVECMKKNVVSFFYVLYDALLYSMPNPNPNPFLPLP